MPGYHSSHVQDVRMHMLVAFSREARSLTNPAIVTRVTKSKVKYTARASGPFTRVFVPYPLMNIVRRVLAERAFVSFPLCLARLVPVSIAKACVTYSPRSEIEVICRSVESTNLCLDSEATK